ncbi:hypothetical protein ACGF5M_04410 [Gemmatimonadota bacterium]
MGSDQQEKADQLFENALEETGARDPREYYRTRLKELKHGNPEGYDEAVTYFRDTLIPSIASGEAEPVMAWLEYGRRIAEIFAEGRTVEVDPSGRSTPYSSPSPLEHLVLHLPNQKNVRALLIGLPPDPSPAQRAAYDLLVLGKQKLHGE